MHVPVVLLNVKESLDHGSILLKHLVGDTNRDTQEHRSQLAQFRFQVLALVSDDFLTNSCPTLILLRWV